MTGVYGIYAIFLLISTITTLYLAFYSWNKLSNPYALYFSFLILAFFIWSITGAFEMAKVAFSTKILWSQLSYIGIFMVGFFWFFIHLELHKQRSMVKKKINNHINYYSGCILQIQILRSNYTMISDNDVWIP
jgi:hypothetical protein